MLSDFLFATGVENSYPTIDGGRTRIDQMEQSAHYKRWSEDFDCVQQLGIEVLRYGPPLHKVWLGPDRYDWEFCDLVYGDLQRRDLLLINDLCHFGVPDWVGNFQNPDFPALFARYAASFASRYPWLQLYTPINEMYICALFSALYGWWNEQMTSDKAFVTALKHIVKANVLAMHAILQVRPDALFIQSESSEYHHPDNPRAIKAAELMNARRFLSLDLNYGRRVESDMYEYLFDNGMLREEYHFFMDHHLKAHCVMGNDYYKTNEHRVAPDGSTRAAGDVFGYDEITLQYYRRYLLPVMHTETNIVQGLNGSDAVDWLWKQWSNLLHVRNKGVPIIGFTWYSITDQVDWQIALRQKLGIPHPVGLFDLDRKIRPVGLAFKQLIEDWQEVLPTQSVCLRLPIAKPSRYEAAARLAPSWPQQPVKYEPEREEQSRRLCSPSNPDM